MTRSFGERLAGVLIGNRALCIGIDPHAALLQAWGLSPDAAGAREFGLRVVEAAAGRASVVKPQIAFFERHGSAGYAALETVLTAARRAGLIVLADVKRGDVGSTVDAYGEAWLTPGSPLEADAMTAVAYQGLGSLDPVLERARAAGKGVFVLAATSNPESRDPQSARRADGRTVAGAIAEDVAALNTDAPVGSVGLVIGATIDPVELGIDPALLARTPILAPGIGHQGAGFADLKLLGDAPVLAAVSRSVLAAGPTALAAAIDAAAAELGS